MIASFLGTFRSTQIWERVMGKEGLPRVMPPIITVCSASSPQHSLVPVHFLSPDQQSGIHCLIICAIQLLTPNSWGGTWRRICSPDIRNVSELEELRNRALQVDTYFTLLLVNVATRWRTSCSIDPVTVAGVTHTFFTCPTSFLHYSL